MTRPRIDKFLHMLKTTPAWCESYFFLQKKLRKRKCLECKCYVIGEGTFGKDANEKAFLLPGGTPPPPLLAVWGPLAPEWGGRDSRKRMGGEAGKKVGGGSGRKKRRSFVSLRSPHA